LKKSIQHNLPHGLLFISDSDGGEPPYPTQATQFRYTASCISVTCMHGQDGRTTITIGSPMAVDPGYAPVISGALKTSGGTVLVSTSEGDVLFETSTPTPETNVRIWVDDSREPSNVHIGIGLPDDERHMSVAPAPRIG
jgi:hypothetical protein